jgi:alpha-tubulin suppressor-like RCC1 family protein
MKFGVNMISYAYHDALNCIYLAHFIIITFKIIFSTVWGQGETGQLGLGNWEGQSSPVVLESLSGLNIVGIGCGHSHSMAFSGGGGNMLWAWGSNEHGE